MREILTTPKLMPSLTQVNVASLCVMLRAKSLPHVPISTYKRKYVVVSAEDASGKV